jgi:exopolyphosphatase/guanosine-5'-triphosphate,3'-diphosphate pyrophosphatase
VARVAAIDLGSNSCVLLVADRGDDGSLQRVHSAIRFTRLGEGVDGTGRLARRAIDRTLAALEELVAIAADWGVESVRCVGTSALREASNRSVVIAGAAEFGLAVTPITGGEEARLSFLAACDCSGAATVLMVDVGGNSTELVRGVGGVADWRTSLPIGSVRLKERHGLVAPRNTTAWRALIADIEGFIASQPSGTQSAVLAVAGTATTAAQMHLGLRAYDPLAIDGAVLTATDLSRLLDRLAPLTVDQRVEAFHLPAARADVLPVGIAILIHVLEAFGHDRLTVRDRGVAWGLLTPTAAGADR